jgi:hypothetical protein
MDLWARCSLRSNDDNTRRRRLPLAAQTFLVTQTSESVCDLQKQNFSGLKPHSFCGAYVVAEATTHKHPRVARQTLRPVRLWSNAAQVKTTQTEVCATGPRCSQRRASSISANLRSNSVYFFFPCGFCFPFAAGANFCGTGADLDRGGCPFARGAGTSCLS